jgi:hypothetical protein
MARSLLRPGTTQFPPGRHCSRLAPCAHRPVWTQLGRDRMARPRSDEREQDQLSDDTLIDSLPASDPPSHSGIPVLIGHMPAVTNPRRTADHNLICVDVIPTPPGNPPGSACERDRPSMGRRGGAIACALDDCHNRPAGPPNHRVRLGVVAASDGAAQRLIVKAAWFERPSSGGIVLMV